MIRDDQNFGHLSGGLFTIKIEAVAPWPRCGLTNVRLLAVCFVCVSLVADGSIVCDSGEGVLRW